MVWLGYRRVSRVGERAERLISPELQAERIEGYASAHGLEVEMLDPELDVSGGKVDRPILNAAIERIEAGEAQGIIVARLDRFSRAGIIDTLRVIERIEAAKGEVISVAENFDARTPEGRMGRNLFLSMGQMQLDQLGAGFQPAKRRAVEAGIWPAPKPPLGYKVTPRKDGGDGRLYPDPETAPKVVRAFEARAAGKPWSKVAEILGVGDAGAARIIANRAYLGEINLQVDGEVIRKTNAHEPLVPRDLWEAAQLDHPRPPRGVHGPALLAGIVRCAGCSRVMTPNMHQRSYRCHGQSAGKPCPAPAWISQKLIDPYVEQAVVADLKAHVKPRPRTDELKEAERALSDAEAELSSFQDATSKVSDLGAEHFAEGLRVRVEAVEAARQRLGQTRGGEAQPGLADALDIWPDLTIEEKRHVLRGALGVVWVRRGRGLAVEDRVRLVPRGQEPPNLSSPGRRAGSPSDLVWDDLPVPVGTSTA